MIEDLKQVRDALYDSKAEFWDDWNSNMSEGDFENHWLIMDIDKSLATLDRIIADHSPDASKMAVPDGFKLVPIELSDENYLYSHPMINAGWNAWKDANEKGLLVSTMLMNIYRAMISAAPQPPKNGD